MTKHIGNGPPRFPKPPASPPPPKLGENVIIVLNR